MLTTDLGALVVTRHVTAPCIIIYGIVETEAAHRQRGWMLGEGFQPYRTMELNGLQKRVNDQTH